MDKLLDLYQELQSSGVLFFTWHLDGGKAATIESGGQYAVFMDFDGIDSRAEEAVVVAHEGGHSATGSTHVLCSPYDLIAKHEYRANAWAYKKLVPRDELRAAVDAGFHEVWELADLFNVTEPFMSKAIAYYKTQEIA